MESHHHHRSRDYPLFNPSTSSSSSNSSSEEFEFNLFGSAGMISADEIFRNGRMLPCSYESPSGHKKCALSAAIRRQNSMPARVNNPKSCCNKSDSSRASAAVTCSSRLQGMIDRAFLRRGSAKDKISRDSSFSSRRFLIPDAAAAAAAELNPDWPLEPLLLQPARSSSYTASRDQSGRPSENKKSSHHLLNQQRLVVLAKSRVYPRSDSCVQSAHMLPRRSISSKYDHQEFNLSHTTVKAPPVLLNMPVCMGDSLKLGVFDHLPPPQQQQNSRRKR